MSGFHHWPGNGASNSEPDHHAVGEMFQCMWDVGHGLHCNALIRGHKLSAHLREAHGIRGSDKDRFWCLWNSCNREFNKESLSRHVEEVHMVISYGCGCGKTYSRRDTLNRHARTCPYAGQH
ncbi:hypothetical protein DFJ58DRAFT_801199 [Suillus subalutaceus]|uniref:uncharacterized protein n=1 Tax=Suillus subalutaceus TaxID=48586 RepID=UPI001B85D680|nr:uncharacterized protein DFJ58DRAFT_801199 [Suillus subalutaceus]KAG1845321.1 hypothetical protein DFJ58DRAFT_801199 [Suillus subalutaceus]